MRRKGESTEISGIDDFCTSCFCCLLLNYYYYYYYHYYCIAFTHI